MKLTYGPRQINQTQRTANMYGELLFKSGVSFSQLSDVEKDSILLRLQRLDTPFLLPGDERKIVCLASDRKMGLRLFECFNNEGVQELLGLCGDKYLSLTWYAGHGSEIYHEDDVKNVSH